MSQPSSSIRGRARSRSRTYALNLSAPIAGERSRCTATSAGSDAWNTTRCARTPQRRAMPNQRARSTPRTLHPSVATSWPRLSARSALALSLDRKGTAARRAAASVRSGSVLHSRASRMWTWHQVVFPDPGAPMVTVKLTIDCEASGWDLRDHPCPALRWRNCRLHRRPASACDVGRSSRPGRGGPVAASRYRPRSAPGIVRPCGPCCRRGSEPAPFGRPACCLQPTPGSLGAPGRCDGRGSGAGEHSGDSRASMTKAQRVHSHVEAVHRWASGPTDKSRQSESYVKDLPRPNLTPVYTGCRL